MTTVIITFIVFLIFVEISNYVIYGKLIFNKRDTIKMYRQLNEYKKSKDTPILLLNTKRMQYIGKRNTSLLYKYYISDVGRVYRYSKLHKKIENAFR